MRNKDKLRGERARHLANPISCLPAVWTANEPCSCSRPPTRSRAAECEHEIARGTLTGTSAGQQQHRGRLRNNSHLLTVQFASEVGARARMVTFVHSSVGSFVVELMLWWASLLVGALTSSGVALIPIPILIRASELWISTLKLFSVAQR